MSRNKLDQIKAAQIEHAEQNGMPHPYRQTDWTDRDTGPNLFVLKSRQIGTSQALIDAGGSTGIFKSALKDYQAALEIDLARIKDENTLEGKARIKSIVLPTYLEFVGHYIDNGDNYPNDVAVQVMIWLLDTGDIEKGLDLALLLIRQGQKMPARFDREMPTFLADTFYDWANEELKADRGASPYLDVLVATAENEQWPMHPLCYSKLYAILAKHKERSGDYAEGVALCDKAEAINPEKAGVKGLKERMQKRLQSN